MSEDLVKLLAQANDAFDAVVTERHIRGSEKYGPLKFLGVNVVEEAMEELADLANYARYTWVKLYLMNQALDRAVGDQELALEGFQSARPGMQGGKPSLEGESE
jgi:hypothetical protein